MGFILLTSNQRSAIKGSQLNKEKKKEKEPLSINDDR